MTAPPVVHEVLRSPGASLDPATRTAMETRFHYDFSRVRIHSDESAARSARDVDANAYTVGSHIVFGAGRFDPGSDAGGRLLAHELTHVVQQNGADRPLLQRDKRENAPPPSAPTKPDPGAEYFHVVVRDGKLDEGGGVLVSDLSAAKATLMNRRVDQPWTLVLSIHASENRLGAQSGPDWQKNAIFYDESDIKALFGEDKTFTAWRDRFGPNRVVLYGCQVTAAFEQTIADNLSRGGKAPTASGLGTGCKPLATQLTFGVSSRHDYDRLSHAEKARVLGEVQEINQTWGYYGAPPVPDGQVLDHLFGGPNKGTWPKVEVIVKQGHDYVPAKPPIPYWNRLSNATFLNQCTEAVGHLHGRTSSVPSVPGDE